MKLIRKRYAVKTSEDRYYVGEAYVYGGGDLERKIVESSEDANEAELFDELKDAESVAEKYNFQVVSVNTYVEWQEVSDEVR